MTVTFAAESQVSADQLALPRFDLPMSPDVLEALPYPLAIYTCDGLCVGANMLVEQLFQAPRADLIGVINILTDSSAENYEVREGFRAALAGQRKPIPPLYYAFTSPTPRASQRAGCWIETTYFPFRDASGAITHIGSIIHDVSDYLLAEQALQQQIDELQPFKILVDNANEGLGIADMTGHIIYGNAAHNALSGYGDQAIGTHISAFFPDAGAQLAQLIPHVIAAGSWSGQLMARRPDGVEWPAAVSAFVMYDETGNPRGMGAIMRDMSEQQRADAEREALQEQVIIAQQAALRELSTPLIPITDDVVAMPLIGSIDSGRAQLILETLLAGVAELRAGTAIIDITGVPVVDTQVANALIRAAQAATLLGARVILTGIRPEVAQTLVNLGVNLGGIVTRGTLQSGIAEALGQLTDRASSRQRQDRTGQIAASMNGRRLNTLGAGLP